MAISKQNLSHPGAKTPLERTHIRKQEDKHTHRHPVAAYEGTHTHSCQTPRRLGACSKCVKEAASEGAEDNRLEKLFPFTTRELTTTSSLEAEYYFMLHTAIQE